MKSTQITKLLKGMIDNLCKTINNQEMINIIKYNSYITGGCIPSMLLDEYVNDFDVYFYSNENALSVKKYYKNKEKTEKFHVKLITDNSINLSDKIQMIIKFTGKPEDVVDSFDWKHIKSYFIYPDKLFLIDDVYKLVMEKELVYTGSEYPLSSLLRTRKFIKKGWHISTVTMTNIILDVVKAFYNPKKLYNQSGVVENNIQNDDEYEHKFSVEEILYHLNGVDPLTIQQELINKCDQRLTIKEIIGLIK